MPDAVSRYSALVSGSLMLTPRKSVSAMAQAIRSLPPRASIGKHLTASDGTQASEIRPDNIIGLAEPERELIHFVEVPEGWIKGQLLNVRNSGGEYVVTVLGEEFDPRYQMRALKFGNSFDCQTFISKWYSREHHDPRAF